jgi:hypothetical protein
VTTTLQENPTDHEERRESHVAIDEGRRAARFDDVDATRRGQAKALVDLTASDRSQLEDLRSRALDRLHRASDDFAATEDLRTVEQALALVPGTHEDSAWQDRVRPPSARPRTTL